MKSRSYVPLLALGLLFSPQVEAAAPPKAYRFTSTAANTFEGQMAIDHAALNGKPTLRLIVTQHSAGVSNPHQVGVRYNHISSRWQIYNEDFENLPLNASFNVLVAPAAKPVGVSQQNLDGNLAFFTVGKGNADANLLVTHMSNPVSALSATRQPANLGLFYIPLGARAPIASGRWALYREDSEPHFAATYNVLDVTKLKVANSLISFRHTATAQNTTAGETVLTNTLTDGAPNAVLFVQHVFTTAGANNVDEALGVRYADGKWRIFSQDGDNLPVPSTFVVAAFPTLTP